MTYKEVTVYIDGEKIDYEGILDNPHFGGTMGGQSGTSGSTNKENNMIGHTLFGVVWLLAIWGENKNGEYWDINGLYESGEWGLMEDGNPYYSVEKRIA